MKKFLILTILAMTSAGIYGFVDMAGDISDGTMIDYRKTESLPKKPAASRVRLAQAGVIPAFAFDGKNEKKKIVPPPPDLQPVEEKEHAKEEHFSYKMYSRSSFEYEPVVSEEITTGIDSALSSGTNAHDSLTLTENHQ